jgi:hypothetical protein
MANNHTATGIAANAQNKIPAETIVGRKKPINGIPNEA